MRVKRDRAQASCPTLTRCLFDVCILSNNESFSPCCSGIATLDKMTTPATQHALTDESYRADLNRRSIAPSAFPLTGAKPP